MDAYLQLLLVAMSKGIGRNFGHVAVPTRIEEIEVARSALAMSAKAGNLNTSEAPGIHCVSEGRTCLRWTMAKISTNAAIVSDGPCEPQKQ